MIDYDKPSLPETTSSQMDGLLRLNLKTLTAFAKDKSPAGNNTWVFSTIDLFIPEQLRERPEQITEGYFPDYDPDAANRAMLEQLYDLSHVDRDRVHESTRQREGPNGTRVDRDVWLPTDHGFVFHESHVIDGDWKNFKVTVLSLDDVKQLAS